MSRYVEAKTEDQSQRSEMKMKNKDLHLHARRPALANALQNRSHHVNRWMAPLCHQQKWPELEHRHFHWTCHVSLQVLMFISFPAMNSTEARWKNGTECNDLTLRYQKTHGLQAHLHNVQSIIQMLKTSDYAQAWKGCLREVPLLLAETLMFFG